MGSPRKRVRILRGLEELEQRTTPVLGVMGPADVAPLGGNNGRFDGVVPIASDVIGSGTGSILSTSTYILTAAHVIGGEDPMTHGLILPQTSINFPISRANNVGPSSIGVQIPAGPNNLFVPMVGVAGGFAAWDWHEGERTRDADIGLIALPDQEFISIGGAGVPGVLGNRAPWRVMIAPFRNTPFGGNRYEVYQSKSALTFPQPFQMVGYGGVGFSGDQGDYLKQVDRITLPGPFVMGTRFELEVTPDGGAPVWIGPFAYDAPEEDIAAELNRVAGGAGNSFFLNRHFNGAVVDGRWDIRRTEGDATITGARQINPGGAQVAGMVEIQWPDDVPGDPTKRRGANEFDQTASHPGWVNPRILEGDFDDTARGISWIGTAGLGNAETNIVAGDSGGPALVGGNPKILGVASYGYTEVGNASDTTRYVGRDAMGRVVPESDSSIGEMFGYTHAQPYMDGFVTPALRRPVHLVLDMKYQAYGTSKGGENLTITAKVEDGNLNIYVTGPEGGYYGLNGKYYSGPVSDILGLTLRGTDDNETFVIEGNLGLLTGKVFIDGRGGTDRVVADNHNSLENPLDYTLGNPDGGGAGYVAEITIPNTTFGIYMRDVDSAQINTSQNMVKENVLLDVVNAMFTGGVEVVAYGAADVATVNRPSVDMNGPVFIKGLIASIGLLVNDSAGPDVDNMYRCTPPNEGSGDPRIIITAGGVARPDFRASNLRTLTLKTTGQRDHILVDSATASMTEGLWVESGAGDDEIGIASVVNGVDGYATLANIKAHLFIDGGAGTNTFSVSDAINPAGGAQYTFGLPDPAVWNPAIWGVWDTQFSRADSAGFLPGILSRGINRYQLQASAKKDIVNFDAAAAAVNDGFFVYGGNGNDDTFVGSAAKGLADILTFVNIDGEAGQNTLTLNDKKGAGGNALIVNKVQGPGVPAGSGNVRRAEAANSKFVEFQNITAPPTINKLALNILGSEGGSDVYVNGLAPETLFLFVGSAKADKLVLAPTGADLANVASKITFRAGGGGDRLAVLAGGSTFNEAMTVNGNLFTLARCNQLLLDWTDLEHFNLSTGSGTDSLRLVNFNPVLGLGYDAGSDTDTVAVASGTVRDPDLRAVEWLGHTGGTLHASAGWPVWANNYSQGVDATLELGVGATSGRVVTGFGVAGSTSGTGAVTLAGQLRMVAGADFPNPPPAVLPVVPIAMGGAPYGEFQGLPEGTRVVVGGRLYAITYAYGGNGGVFLTDTGADVPPRGGPAYDGTPYYALAGGYLVGDLTAKVASTAGGPLAFAGGQVTAQGGDVDIQPEGRFKYHPADGFTGTDTFAVTATDAAGNATTLTIVVVVLPPGLAATDYGYTIAANSFLRDNVLTHDAGLNEGQGVTVAGVSLLAGTQHGSLSLRRNGDFLYVPDADFTGTDTFQYEVTDSLGHTATAWITVTVIDGYVQP